MLKLDLKLDLPSPRFQFYARSEGHFSVWMLVENTRPIFSQWKITASEGVFVVSPNPPKGMNWLNTQETTFNQ